MSSSGIPGFEALFADVNKLKGDSKDNKEGITSSLLPELELSMSDDKLIGLTKDWMKGWEQYQGSMNAKWSDNEQYWLGQNRTRGEAPKSDAAKPNADNLIFEALETFLPLATKESPEPVVEADNTVEGLQLSEKVESMLIFLTRQLDLKLTLKSVMRNWSLYFLGCMKIGWSSVNNEIAIAAIRPKRLILDKDATIVNGEYTGDFIGEIRKNSASDLARIFPKKKKFLEEAVQGKMGTELNYTEWWTDDFVFWTYKNEVLDKKRNPHWNYNTEAQKTDEFGNVTTVPVKGKNHFPVPKKPYVFLSIFNLGQHPFDDTNLVHQNLKTQDMISKRLKQIDTNADNTNGGTVVSGDFFTKEQAAKVGEAKRRGETVWVPTGDVNRAYKQDVGPPLPPFVYESLRDYRVELKNNFGISGTTPGTMRQEKSVRGKIMAKQHDSDRIGGAVVEYLEQMVEQTYGWFVQMMHVYYDEPHVASIIGADRARVFTTLKNTEFGPKLTVYVKEGSLLPKDTVSRRNEAVELWAQHALDPITLFQRLEFPNPYDAAKRLFMWMTNPASLFPDIQQPLAPVEGQPAPPPPAAPLNPMQPGPGRPQLPGTGPLTNTPPVPMTPMN